MSFPSKYKLNANASAGLLFIKAYNLWHTTIKRSLAECGLTHPQFVFLACTAYLLQNNEHVTQNMISEFSDIDVMTVSQIAVLLEKNKLILRQPHPTDTRAKSVVLIQAGQAALQKSMPVVEEIDRIFFAKLGSKQKEFLGMLQKLTLQDNK